MPLTFLRNLGIVSSAGISTTKLGTGAVLQVVQTTSVSSLTTTSASFVTLNLAATITPSSASSKILMLFSTNAQNTTGSNGCVITIYRGSIAPSSASSKILVLVNHNGCRKDTNNTTLMVRLLRGSSEISGIEGAGGNTGSSATNVFGGIGITYLDSPATTSSITYKTQLKSGANNATVYINDVNSGGSSQSTITLLEIAV